MNKTILISEAQLTKMVKLIVEQYSNEDYIEVFFHYFRPWIKEKHGEEISEYPISYLVKKYLKEFITHYGIDDRLCYRDNISNISYIGRELVQKGVHKLKTLRVNKKFTEKYKRAIEIFKEGLNLPEYISLIIVEKEPFDVNMHFSVSWQRLIKNNSNPPNLNTIAKDISFNIENYLGVERGNPEHGELKLNISTNAKYVGLEEWIKKVLNQEIKKKIKELSNSSVIHRIKFEARENSLGGDIRIIYKEGYWRARGETLDKVRQLLSGMGYNTNILRVENV